MGIASVAVENGIENKLNENHHLVQHDSFWSETDGMSFLWAWYSGVTSVYPMV
jgi:hypothetical protein